MVGWIEETSTQTQKDNNTSNLGWKEVDIRHEAEYAE